jgi:hypothetical protein
MRKYLVVPALLAALATPASAQLNSQQQRMKDCNAQASGVSGEARQQFMSSCLSNKPAAETNKPHCVKGKPCGNSCIAKDKVCHKP